MSDCDSALSLRSSSVYFIGNFVLVVYVCFNFALICKFNEKREKRNKVCKHFRRKSEKMTVRDER